MASPTRGALETLARKITFPTVVAGTLWGISGTMTVALFIELAGSSPVALWAGVFWAGALEATKIRTWLQGGLYRILSVLLVGLTLFSALGMALWSISLSDELRSQNLLSRDPAHLQDLKTLDQLDRQMHLLEARFAQLPPDFTTAARNLTEAMGVLRQSQNDIRRDLDTIRNRSLQGSDSGPLGRVASFLGLNRQGLQTVVVLIVAVLTEVSVLVMASLRKHPGRCRTERESPQQSRRLPIQADDYLSAALDHPGRPRLLGRRTVAHLLDLTETQAKDHLRQLLQEGRIRREGKTFQATGK